MANHLPPKIVKRRIAMAAFLVVVIISSGIVVFGVLSTLYNESHEAPLPGIPIENTVFAGLANAAGDPAFLPAGPLISNYDSVTMNITEAIDQPIISQEEAEQIGANSFSQFPYMSGVTLEPDHFWNELRDNPYYSLRYFVGQYEFYAGVNALTGRVIVVSPHWSVLMQYNTSTESEVLSVEEIQECAYEFLEWNNYSLSSTARVETPVIEKDTILTNFPAYHLKFYCSVNGCLIPSNYLSMLLSIKTGVVMRFIYHWRNITHIPVENVVPALNAENVARAHLSQNLQASNFTIISSSLQFRKVTTWPILKLQLCWLIDIRHELYGPIVINALNLEVLQVGQKVNW
ncbi:MAG: hypothetical protein ACFFD3_04180 [Candidatus Thorarchaeota archaeon]